MDAIALRCQIRIEPFRRRYSDAEAERLHDLFGERQRWADTLKPLQFTTVSIMVPGFTGSTEVDAARPVHLRPGDRLDPVLRRWTTARSRCCCCSAGPSSARRDGRLQVQQVPWSKETTFRLPVSLWREAVDAHFPDTAWITMSRQTLDELSRFKTRHALPTWDATVAALLAQAGQEES